MIANNQVYALALLVAISGGAIAGFSSTQLETPTETAVKEDVSHGRRLLVFESPGCGWCTRFRSDIEPAYLETNYQDRAPLYYVKAATRMGRDYGIRSTPTIVLVEGDGREIARIVGYPRDRLYRFLDKHL